MRRHLLAIAVILTGATGCDNVAWGGIEWRLMSPPSAGADPGGDPVDAALEEPAPRVYGPLLLAGEVSGARATLVVVGEVLDDALGDVGTGTEDVEHVERLTVPGSEWVLFSEGVRVGTLVADSAASAGEYCPARRTVSGVVELVPTASGATRLLALPSAIGMDRAYDAFRPLEDVYDQRVATLAWAGEAIPRNRATWPDGGLVEARQDIQVFQPAGAPGPAVAATFMFRDRLSVGPAARGAYALFVLGELTGGEYREDYSWYRPVDPEGKGAPRYFDHLDWDGDGDAEILLEVFGADRRWFAALSRRGGRWVRTYQDVCGAGPSPGG